MRKSGTEHLGPGRFAGRATRVIGLAQVPLIRSRSVVGRARWFGGSVVALLTCLSVVSVATGSQFAAADVLGRVTGIQRNPSIVVIDGQRLRVAAESRLYEAVETSNEAQVMSFSSLSVGDYVVYESDGDVLVSMQRVEASAIDVAPVAPILIQPREGR